MPAGKITALRAQVKDPQRVNVFVEGEFAIGVSLNTITKAGLHVGKQLTAEEFAHLEQTESGDKAYLAALRFLEARPRSIAEVRARLGRKDFAPEAIDAAIARLAELELLDDEIVELKEWDAVRVPPGTWRGYEAGPEGLEIIVIGAPNLGESPRDDVEGQRDWWA